MSCGLLKELQALIAFACYDLPSVIKRGASLADGAIKDVMTYIFYGVTDPDLITYVDQFKLGLRKFKGLCTQSHRQDQMLVCFWGSSTVDSGMFIPSQDASCLFWQRFN